MKVVDVSRLVDGTKDELVRRSVDEAALDAAAGEPHREAIGVVVANAFATPPEKNFLGDGLWWRIRTVFHLLPEQPTGQ